MSRTSSPSVVVIGNFDGVHRGHQSVVQQARRLGRGRGLDCVVLTFDPHPNEVLGRGVPPKLTTYARRVELLRSYGAGDVVAQPFTAELATWSPEQFARELLTERFRARAVVVGENFRFGARRAGDFAVLAALGETLGFSAIAAEVAGDAKGPFSSSRVREAIGRADLDEARSVLGRAHAISGVVVHGDARGRTIGFPTANLAGVVEMLPPHGVYAVRARSAALGPVAAGVMNIGTRPTVDGTSLRIEVHLFDFDADLYGAELRVEVLQRVRDERKFAGVGELRAQITADVQRARELLGT